MPALRVRIPEGEAAAIATAAAARCLGDAIGDVRLEAVSTSVGDNQWFITQEGDLINF